VNQYQTAPITITSIMLVSYSALATGIVWNLRLKLYLVSRLLVLVICAGCLYIHDDCYWPTADDDSIGTGFGEGGGGSGGSGGAYEGGGRFPIPVVAGFFFGSCLRVMLMHPGVWTAGWMLMRPIKHVSVALRVNDQGSPEIHSRSHSTEAASRDKPIPASLALA
jgi:hypothetical protein